MEFNQGRSKQLSSFFVLAVLLQFDIKIERKMLLVLKSERRAFANYFLLLKKNVMGTKRAVLHVHITLSLFVFIIKTGREGKKCDGER